MQKTATILLGHIPGVVVRTWYIFSEKVSIKEGVASPDEPHYCICFLHLFVKCQLKIYCYTKIELDIEPEIEPEIGPKIERNNILFL